MFNVKTALDTLCTKVKSFMSLVISSDLITYRFFTTHFVVGAIHVHTFQCPFTKVYVCLSNIL